MTLNDATKKNQRMHAIIIHKFDDWSLDESVFFSHSSNKSNVFIYFESFLGDFLHPYNVIDRLTYMHCTRFFFSHKLIIIRPSTPFNNFLCVFRIIFAEGYIVVMTESNDRLSHALHICWAKRRVCFCFFFGTDRHHRVKRLFSICFSVLVHWILKEWKTYVWHISKIIIFQAG